MHEFYFTQRRGRIECAFRARRMSNGNALVLYFMEIYSADCLSSGYQIKKCCLDAKI